MNVRLARKIAQPRRGGFTLIELLVVISIIAVLASLILPGVQNAREAARRMTCMNNMRNVGLAVSGYVTANNGAFPALAGGGDCWQLNADGTAAAYAPAPWTVALLPYLEQAGLYDQLVSNSTNATTSTDANVLATLRGLRDVVIKVYTCPDDLTSDEPGGFSFAANAGLIGQTEWADAAADVSHRIDAYQWRRGSETAGSQTPVEYAKRAVSTGVFWREDSARTRDQYVAGTTPYVNTTGQKMTVDRMRDGTSQTLMLTENLSNGGWLPAYQTGFSAIRGAATGDLGFGLKVAGAATGGIFTPTNTLDYYGGAGMTLSSATGVLETQSRINNNLTATVGTAPRPSSYHPQIVNVIFCDGHGQTLNQSIADSVYARLLTPNTNIYGSAILSGNDF